MKATRDVLAAVASVEAEGRVTDQRRQRKAQTLPVTFALNCQVKSEANQRGHWAVKHRRFKAQAEILAIVWRASIHGSLLLPLRVTFTHLGRRMDSDNLAGAFKACRDQAAKLLGVDDGDPRVEWRYEQASGKGVLVKIEAA